MDVGKEIISKAVLARDLGPFIDAGLDDRWLHDKGKGADDIFGDNLGIYERLLTEHRKFGRIKDEDTFRKNHPTFRISQKDYTVDEIIDEAHLAIKRVTLNVALAGIVDADDNDDIDGAIQVVHETSEYFSRRLVDEPDKSDILGADERTGTDILADREQLERVDFSIPGYTPQITMGTLTVFLGRQKAGKTTLMMDTVHHAWKQGYSSVVFSVELVNEFLIDKFYAIGSGVSPTAIERNELDEKSSKKYNKFHQEVIEARKENVEVVFTENKKVTIASIREAIDKYRPHMVFIDGFYFMVDDRPKFVGETPLSNHNTNDYLANELNEIAKSTGVAIIVTTQVREKQHNQKKAIESASIAGGTGLNMACNLMVGVDKAPFKQDTYWITTPLNRRGEQCEVFVTRDWTTMELMEENDPVMGVDF